VLVIRIRIVQKQKLGRVLDSVDDQPGSVVHPVGAAPSAFVDKWERAV